MSVSGTVDDVERVEEPRRLVRAWRVLVVPDSPTAIPGGDGKPLGMLAFYMRRPDDPSETVWATAPLARGDRLTLPLQIPDRRLTATRPDGSTVQIRMLGFAVDPAAQQL